MTDDAEPLKRLAAYVEQRIATLGLEYAEVARLAGFSIEVLRKVRNGINARGSTYRKLERALQWESGSIATILAGGEPTLVEAAAGVAPESGETLSSQELEILQDLVVSTASRLGLSPEEMDEAYRRARAELERRRAAGGQEGSSPPPRRRRAG
jgi:hypothetical protein